MHEAMRHTLAMFKSEVRRRDLAPTTAAAGACFSSRRRPRPLLPKVMTTCSPSAALCCGILSLLPTATTRVAALTEITNVAAPTSNLTAGTYHAVGWVYSTDTGAWGTTGDLRPFEIELRSCGGDAAQQAECGLGESCGNPYRALCDLETGAACMDSDGSYDVLIPEDVDAGRYVFSVTHLGLSSWTSGTSSTSDSGLVTGCSESFFVEEAAAKDVLAAEAPTASFLQPGDAFTAEWEYEDADGETDGSFEVNLFSCADQACEQDSCGTLVAELCGEAGCYDPGPGDYDVRIPADTTPGTFKLQVKRVSTGEEACSAEAFAVEAAASDSSSGTRAISTPAPVPAAAAATTTPAPVVSSTEAPVPAATGAPAPAATGAPVPAATPAPVAAAAESAPVPLATSSATESGEVPGTPPTPVPPRVTCDPAAVVAFSYELETSTLLPLITISHESEDRDEGGCTNFSELWEWVKTQDADVQELLYPADPTTGEADTTGGAATGVWLLRTSVDVTNGVMFEVMGTQAEGGDSDKILLSSSPTNYFRIRGAGGHLYFYQTEVTSWVEEDLAPHTLPDDAEWGAEPRSYIGCLSEILEEGQTCDGVAKKERGECRMDIIESIIAYLGYEATESYGLSWKVRGLCTDLSNQDTLFDSVRVYGDLQDSDIYGLWYGHYSYGHLGGVWTNNFMHDNHVYGFDPHDDSDYLTITGNTCYNNGNHGIIASKRCDHLLVENNESYDNGGSGIMLHKSCDYSTVRSNTLYGNFDAGLSLVETSHTLVTENTLNDNKYGIRLVVGSNDNTITTNSVSSNSQHDVYLYIGSSSDVAEVAPYTGINERNFLR
ncbi:unnamed protein product [Ectocarpus sp. 12 AP-2014]